MRPEQNEMIPERNEQVPEHVEQRQTAHTEAHTGAHNGAHTEAHTGAQTGAHTGDGPRERLVPADRAESYGSRWNAVKGAFVDEPRQAVAQADELVGEVLDELETLFREQRRRIEQELDSDEASTEDLRVALGRYRSFFDRLLAV